MWTASVHNYARVTLLVCKILTRILKSRAKFLSAGKEVQHQLTE